MNWACSEKDVFLNSRVLSGEGRWFIAYCFETTLGDYYEVWVDQDGDSQVLDYSNNRLFKK